MGQPDRFMFLGESLDSVPGSEYKEIDPDIYLELVGNENDYSWHASMDSVMQSINNMGVY